MTFVGFVPTNVPTGPTTVPTTTPTPTTNIPGLGVLGGLLTSILADLIFPSPTAQEPTDPGGNLYDPSEQEITPTIPASWNGGQCSILYVITGKIKYLQPGFPVQEAGFAIGGSTPVPGPIQALCTNVAGVPGFRGGNGSCYGINTAPAYVVQYFQSFSQINITPYNPNQADNCGNLPPITPGTNIAPTMEYDISPSPDITSLPTATPSPVPTIEPSPIETPTPIEIPTIEPTPIPTPSPVPFPSPTPTPIPTTTPTPVPSPSPSPTPTTTSITTPLIEDPLDPDLTPTTDTPIIITLPPTFCEELLNCNICSDVPTTGQVDKWLITVVDYPTGVTKKFYSSDGDYVLMAGYVQILDENGYPQIGEIPIRRIQQVLEVNSGVNIKVIPAQGFTIVKELI